MAIQYLKTNINGQFVRPRGFTFPIGLSQTVAAVTGGPPTVDYLVIAGGGGGGTNHGGGGGAGGYRTATGFSITQGTPLTVTVGAGGPLSLIHI